MFDLHQIGPEARDCTAPYNLILHHPYTVHSLIKDILINRSDEWGTITIVDGHQILDDCTYRYGELQNAIFPNLLCKTVIRATASGGWSNMDYVITVTSETTTSGQSKKNRVITTLRSFFGKH